MNRPAFLPFDTLAFREDPSVRYFARTFLSMLNGVPTQVNATSPEKMSPASTHVLVVDDDPSIRQMIVDYLGDNEIQVTALASGREIADVTAREMIDLLILDLKLPGEDGMDIARRIRADSNMPIIMLTGRKEEADRVMALELGADDYLTKPFSPRELLARIRALLRRSRAHETVADGLAKIRAYRFAGWELNVRVRRLKSPQGEVIDAEECRVQPACGVSCLAAAGAYAGAVARHVAPAQRRGLRPRDRHPGRSSAQEARRARCQPGTDTHRARSGVRIYRTRRSRALSGAWGWRQVALMRYFNDGRIEIDNSAVEHALRARRTPRKPGTKAVR